MAEAYTGGTQISAGTLELGAGGSIFGNLAFTDGNAGATLRLDTGTVQLGGKISGFDDSDHIDLKFLSYSASLKPVWVQDTATYGTLSIKKGNVTLASLSLTGVYTSQSFSLANDGVGGTLISDPPPNGNSNAHGNSSTQLVQAIASFSSGGGLSGQETGLAASQDPGSQPPLLTLLPSQH
jgi:hypothetical protein